MRDAQAVSVSRTPTGGSGTSYIAAIGIDRYRSWDRLANAVSDATAAVATFQRFGFRPLMSPLLDGDATRDALHRLATQQLRNLKTNDSVIVFFAGHGHTQQHPLSNHAELRTGYLIPVDGLRPTGRDVSSWLTIDTWLVEVARCPARHVLVILDACHSGIAVGNATPSRGLDSRPPGDTVRLDERRSRRVITSALDVQQARDDGPIHGHSVFTGCLLDTLQSSAPVTSTELAVATARRVRDYTRDQQIPEFDTLAYDDRGELLFRLAATPPEPAVPPPALPVPLLEEPRGHPIARSAPSTVSSQFGRALDRQLEQRRQGASILSVVAGNSTEVLTGWAAWAASHGYLTYTTSATTSAAAVSELLAQVPWVRCVPGARRRLASAAGIDVNAVDATLDARAPREQARWIENVAALNRHARVSGWLLLALRESRAAVPDLTTAPVRQLSELLETVSELASPTAVLFRRDDADATWFQQAVPVAAALAKHLPGIPVGIGAPRDVVHGVLSTPRPGESFSMARQGRVNAAAPQPLEVGRARSRAEQVLFDALQRNARTKDRFYLNAHVTLGRGEPDLEVDLLAPDLLLAVEIDGWFHFRDPRGYRRDRTKDQQLQRAGYFVMRFLAEDVDSRLAFIVDEIAIAVRARRASGSRR